MLTSGKKLLLLHPQEAAIALPPHFVAIVSSIKAKVVGSSGVNGSSTSTQIG